MSSISLVHLNDFRNKTRDKEWVPLQEFWTSDKDLENLASLAH